jgi:2-polyprenyl-3-methyl-5-hydroxy-6-metoxy-1,4-benzoquinol methylase
VTVRQFRQWRAEKAQLAVTHVMPLVDEPPVPDPEPVSDPRRVVRTLAELDVELKNLDRLGAISDDALRGGFQEFRMEIADTMPADPWSPEYRAKVFEMYEFLHNKPYETSNEVNEFDIETHVRAPFPYITGSAATVGSHLIGIGHLIRTMDLPPNSRVLEMGPGWGNTTLALAQMGHTVTAIDIADNFVKLIAERGRRIGADIDARQGDFALMKELEPGFDAVLFFECFHHAADHLDVLASLDRIVKPGGRVIFAAEPIVDGFPYPWGLRLEGEALWAIRNHGWLELGFQTSYFEEALARNGWSMRHVDTLESQWGLVIVAERLSEQTV